jgi:hypothetical protein
MERGWVDFKKIKEAVDIQMVLAHYGIISLSKHGEELRGSCPIHRGSAKSKTFTINVRKNAFQCFSKECNARGNVLDFVSAMERCDVRNAALKLAEWFKIGESESPADEDAAPAEVPRGIYADSKGVLFEVITPALSGEDFAPMIVYRQLSGDYNYFVAPPQNFGATDCRFNLIKSL